MPAEVFTASIAKRCGWAETTLILLVSRLDKGVMNKNLTSQKLNVSAINTRNFTSKLQQK